MPSPAGMVSSGRTNASIGRVEYFENFYDLNIGDVIQQATNVGFEFICYFVGGEDRAKFDPWADERLTCADIPPIVVVDIQMKASDWARLVVGRFSPWIDLDSNDPRIRKISEIAFAQELNYMRYLGLSAVIVELKNENFSNLARTLGQYLWGQPSMTCSVWVVVPATSQTSDGINGEDSSEESNQKGKDGGGDPWQWWYKMRTLTGNCRRMVACVKVTADLPDVEEMKRWLGEPVASFWVDTGVFQSNKVGWPVLSKPHQLFVRQLFGLGCQAVVSGSVDPVCDSRANRSLGVHREYLSHLWEERPGNDDVSKWSAGYEDFLQVPIQPLADNLESSIYEVFEADPVKYIQYRKAVYLALEDLCVPAEERNSAEVGAEQESERGRSISSGDRGEVLGLYKEDRKEVVIMVLGAGRGPLVSACIAAFQELKLETTIRAKFYAVEKNENSVVTLNFLKATAWLGADVTVVHSDMRTFAPGFQADIVVSELLGSFGDNELSPECLDGAVHLMNKNTVCIPSGYTSYLSPLHSPKVHAAIRDELGVAAAACAKSKEGNVHAIFEQLYVVRLHNRYEISEPQPVFTFKHPNFTDESKERRKTLEFTTKLDCEVMGLVGYFDCYLYKDVSLSIVPQTHSQGMFSWFPVVFPLQVPVKVEKGAKIKVRIWRMTSDDSVWYEWCLLAPVITSVQNNGGAAFRMKL